jgi:hypothetical protein
MVASLPLITNDELRMTSWVLVASFLLITNDKLRMTNLVAEALEAVSKCQRFLKNANNIHNLKIPLWRGRGGLYTRFRPSGLKSKF